MSAIINLIFILRYLLITTVIAYIGWQEYYAPKKTVTPVPSKSLLQEFTATPFYSVPPLTLIEPYLKQQLHAPLFEVVTKPPPKENKPPVVPVVIAPPVVKPQVQLLGTILEDSQRWAILGTVNGQSEIVSPGKQLTLIPGNFLLLSVTEQTAIIKKEGEPNQEFTIPLNEKK